MRFLAREERAYEKGLTVFGSGEWNGVVRNDVNMDIWKRTSHNPAYPAEGIFMERCCT